MATELRQASRMARIASGERFEPPASLVEKAERGEIYSDEEALVSAG